MNVRVATVLYAIAVAAIPIGVASKFLLGITGAVWIDPTLLLALAALLALFPRWGDFLTGGLRLAVIGAAALFFLSLVCTLSGVLLRPPSSLYIALREPLRLWLNLCWFLLSCWFLAYKPRVILVCSIVAVTFGLAAGIYLHLVAIGVAPAPAPVISYTRAYFFRQAIWFNGIPIPRMGGLFFESPPFGLFMFSMLIVLSFTRDKGYHPKWTACGITFAVLGMLFSLADQVLIAGTVGLLASLPHLAKSRPRDHAAVVNHCHDRDLRLSVSFPLGEENLLHQRHGDRNQRWQRRREKLPFSLWTISVGGASCQPRSLASVQDDTASMRAKPALSQTASMFKHRSWSSWWSGA